MGDVKLGIVALDLELLAQLKRHDAGDVAAAIVVEEIFFQWVGSFCHRGGLDKDDDILKATVRFDQIRLVRQCLAAVILILTYFDQRKLGRGVREPDIAEDRTCVSIVKG